MVPKNNADMVVRMHLVLSHDFMMLKSLCSQPTLRHVPAVSAETLLAGSQAVFAMGG